jgi:hypothetical protein
VTRSVIKSNPAEIVKPKKVEIKKKSKTIKKGKKVVKEIKDEDLEEESSVSVRSVTKRKHENSCIQTLKK